MGSESKLIFSEEHYLPDFSVKVFGLLDDFTQECVVGQIISVPARLPQGEHNLTGFQGVGEDGVDALGE